MKILLGDLDAVSEIIENGFDVNTKDELERTGLHYASENGRVKIRVNSMNIIMEYLFIQVMKRWFKN